MCGAELRRSIERTSAEASRPLVSLLSVLGRAARLLRRTRLTGCMAPVSHVIFGRTLGALARRGYFGAGTAAAAALGALAPDIDARVVFRGWDGYLRVPEIG